MPVLPALEWRNYHDGNCTGCVTLDIWKIVACGIRQSYLLSFDLVWPTVVEEFMATRWEYGSMVLAIERRLWTPPQLYDTRI